MANESAVPPSPSEVASIRSYVEPSDSNWANKYEDFDIGKPIGYGSSAIVYAAIYKPLKKRVALKMIDLDMFERNQIDELRRETALMALSKHPNILRVYGSFVIGSKLYIVTPYLSAGSCLDIMKTAFQEGLDEVAIATVLRQALEGLCYLHKNGHIHRDVKAGNLLMDQQGNVLLADFGVSSSLSEKGDVRKTFVGTPCWMAPEVMEQAGYDYKADIWSFGITAIELATGHAPFAKYPPMKVLMMTLSNAPPTLDRDHCKHKYSKTFKDMIDLCLQKDPAKRPNAEKLMLHPFFKQAKRKDYLAKHILPSVPPLDQRPNKKVPEKSISCENTEQWDFDTQDKNDGDSVQTESKLSQTQAQVPVPAQAQAQAQAQEKPRQTMVKFKEKPKPIQITRMRSQSTEGSPVTPELKKHISFGDVTIGDNNNHTNSNSNASDSVKPPFVPPLCESPAPYNMTPECAATPIIAATPTSKKSRFVVADNNPGTIYNLSTADPSHISNNSSTNVNQGANTAIPDDAIGVGLGISTNGGGNLISTPSFSSSVHPTEVEVKKGRFSVNQTPTLRPTTNIGAATDSPYDLGEKHVPLNEIKASPIIRSSSQDSLQSERKSRFGIKINTSNFLPTGNSLEPSTPLLGTPITRESSNGSVLSRESKVSRFSVEKNENPAVNSNNNNNNNNSNNNSNSNNKANNNNNNSNNSNVNNNANGNNEVLLTPAGCLSPESRKKGRFELSGGINGPNDNFKLDRENSFDHFTPTISPNNTILKGQSHRLTDTSTSHLMQGHLEYLLKQADIQKNILNELLSGLPTHQLVQPAVTPSRFLWETRRATLPEDFQPKTPVSNPIPKNNNNNNNNSSSSSLNGDINSNIEHLQQLVIASFKEKEKLIRENEELRREVERLRRNQNNNAGGLLSKKNSFDHGLPSAECFEQNTLNETS